LDVRNETKGRSRLIDVERQDPGGIAGDARNHVDVGVIAAAYNRTAIDIRICESSGCYPITFGGCLPPTLPATAKEHFRPFH
jgi:hypothetical protein